MITEQSSNSMFVTGHLDPQCPETVLQFADGRIVRVPTSLLKDATSAKTPQAPTLSGPETVLIPLVEERLEVGKHLVETGRVQLLKGVETYDVTLDEPLAVTGWQVERVAKHEIVAEAPPSRQQGETTIYPIVEERLVVTKELVLVEEVHVTRAITERRDTQTVTLRRETLDVKRKAADQL